MSEKQEPMSIASEKIFTKGEKIALDEMDKILEHNTRIVQEIWKERLVDVVGDERGIYIDLVEQTIRLQVAKAHGQIRLQGLALYFILDKVNRILEHTKVYKPTGKAYEGKIDISDLRN